MTKKKILSHLSVKNFAITFGILAIAFGAGLFLHLKIIQNAEIAPIFILAVLLISRFTDGYFYGIFASVFSILGVNYAFTYPYFSLNFTLSGYPVTFAVMLCVSVVVSALTTMAKRQEKIKAEIELEKSRANLLRSISHDIRTPLTSIIGSSSAFLDNTSKLSDESKRELVLDIRDEANWLLRIVENVLSVTKINQSPTEISKNSELIEEIIEVAAIKFRKQFPNISLKATVPDSILFVPMDATLIEQVIFNLLENAVIHGEKTTDISLSVAKGGREVIFSVCDNGNGISKNLLPHLFDGSFVNGKEKHSDTKRNMGIGLSVCKTIITAHGGVIWAENQKSGGAAFYFTLPLDEEIL